MLKIQLLTRHVRVDLFNPASIRSTPQFVSERAAWRKGVVREVLVMASDEAGEVPRVVYRKHGKEFAKNLLRWSHDVRCRHEARKVSEEVGGYRAGAKVMMWSNVCATGECRVLLV